MPRNLVLIAFVLLCCPVAGAQDAKGTVRLEVADGLPRTPQWSLVRPGESPQRPAAMSDDALQLEVAAGAYDVYWYQGAEAVPVAKGVTVTAGGAATVRADTGLRIEIGDWAPARDFVGVLPAGAKSSRFGLFAKEGNALFLAPGKYDVYWSDGKTSSHVLARAVAVEPGKVSTLAAGGIRLKLPADVVPFDYVEFRSGAEEFRRPDGLALVPPGEYAVTWFQARHLEPDRVAERVAVAPGKLVEIDYTPPFGRIDAAPPEKVRIHGAGRETQLVVLWGGKAWRPEEFPVRAGDVTLRLRTGATNLDLTVPVAAGETKRVPFDPAAWAAQNRLVCFRVSLRDAAGAAVSEGAQLQLLRDGDLVALEVDPSPETRWLAPPGTVVQARFGRSAEWLRDLPVGELREAVLTFASEVRDAAAEKPVIDVDVSIESPEDGATVETDTVELVGHAFAGAKAGATRVALVLDVSGSTHEGSGADVDGDGQAGGQGSRDTILRAELAAARTLLDKLEALEDASPGTTYEVALFTFSDAAEQHADLGPLTQPATRARLRRGLDAIAARGPGGNTNYAGALREVVKRIRPRERPGRTIVLFMTDGAPAYQNRYVNDLVDEIVDVAAWAGAEGAILHTVGLGKDFREERSAKVGYPPAPTNPVDILATMAALAYPGGEVLALPNPGDIVKVAEKLPTVELPDARIREVVVENETTGRGPVGPVELSRDGGFRAVVPVSFAKERTNRLTATALAADGVSRNSASVTVRGVARVTSVEVEITSPKANTVLADARKVRVTGRAIAKGKPGIRSVRIRNEATGDEVAAELGDDGTFAADVPVSLTPAGDHLTNTLVATATALDGVTTGSDQVTVEGLRRARRVVVTIASPDDGAAVDPRVERVTLTGKVEVVAPGIPDAGVKSLHLVNATTGEKVADVRLKADGTFAAAVPVAFAKHASNRLVATATAFDGVTEGSDDVTIRRIEHAERVVVTIASPEEGTTLEARAGRVTLTGRVDVVAPGVPDAGVRGLVVVNATTGEKLGDVAVAADGTFTAKVPFDFADHPSNRMVVTATAFDGVTTGTDDVTVRGPPAAATIRVVERDGGAGESDGGEATAAILLVVDCSGSMKYKIRHGGERIRKYRVARDVIRGLARDLPESVQLGLRIFPSEDDGDRSRMALPVGPMTAERSRALETVLRELVKPGGRTPMVQALLDARRDFDQLDAPGRKYVIMVGDGKETAGGKIEDVRDAYAGGDVDLVMHVIGFDVQGNTDEHREAREMMQAVARIGRGKYYDAADAEALARALRAAARVSRYEVVDRAGAVVATGRINGPPVTVKPGDYEVRLVEIEGKRTKVAVRPGQAVTVRLTESWDFEK